MITAEKEFKLQVTDGPSKMDLFMSLATAMEKKPNHPFMVEFEIEGGKILPSGVNSTAGDRMQARILGISHEDGSGKSFCIEGTLYDNRNGELSTPLQCRFNGYYHTGSCSGYLAFNAPANS